MSASKPCLGSLANSEVSMPSCTSSQAYTFAMVAGEASGDTLGANLIEALLQRYPNAKFVGIGGRKMQALGFQSWYPLELLSVMGFVEVLKSLPKLLKLRKDLTGRLLALKPDAFIGIDAPDFNFTLERKLKRQGIPTVHYVGPSVWAWREKRLIKIQKAVNGVLVLFPFEPQIYHRYQIPVKFVGHPLAAKRPIKLNRVAACDALKLSSKINYTVVLVGSRSNEIKHMAPVYLSVCKKLKQHYPEMEFIFPLVDDTAKTQLKHFAELIAPQLKPHWVVGQVSDCLQAASQALVTSGTASLECALYELPMVIAIKVHRFSYWIMKRLAKTRWVGLPNVLQNDSLVKEYIQEQATADNIYQAMRDVIDNVSLRKHQITAFQQQYKKLNVDSATLAATAIQEWALPAESTRK